MTRYSQSSQLIIFCREMQVRRSVSFLINYGLLRLFIRHKY